MYVCVYACIYLSIYLSIYLCAFVLSNYRYDGVISGHKNSSMFPVISFGQYVLSRIRLIDLILKEIEQQKRKIHILNSGASIYMYGCRGMGKTSNLLLIGKALIENGYEVYYFLGSSCFNSPSCDVVVKDLLKD